MIAATLFSGIGAPEVAMPEWDWPWHAEIEKFPSAVMAARHPNSINLGDVSADDFTERAAAIARPDVLVFGSPCQSYSIAGKRLGLDDPRGNLALVALGIVDRLKPDWFVFENVPGLLSSAEGRDFGLLLRTVDELGYSLAWTVLDAQYFGVAQRRARVFAVGYIGDWRYPAAILFEPEGLCGHNPPRREAGKSASGGAAFGISSDCFDRSGEGANATAGERSGLGVERELAYSIRAKRPGGVAHALNAKGGSGRIDGESETFVAHSLRADGFDASEDGTGRGTPLVTHPLDSFSEDGTGRGCPIVPVAFSCKDHGADASDIAPTMRAMGHSGSHANAGGQLAVAVALRGREGGATAELSDVPSALRASSGGGDKAHVLFNVTPSNSNKDYNARPSERSQALTGSGNRPSARGGDLIASTAVRRLTPRECERLQGFPDDYTLITIRGKPAADGPRYKHLGNSMARPVMRWILKRIERAAKLTPGAPHP